MQAEPYDVAVVGAGPSGATAAILLARNHRRVVLVDRARFPRPVPCAGWLNARSAALLDELHLPAGRLKKYPFLNVTFHRADFSKSTQPRFSQPPGFLIDRSEFDNVLVESAAARGVEFLSGCPVANVALKESSVCLQLGDGRSLEARLLLVASGRQTPLLECVGFVGATGDAGVWTAQVEAAAPPGKESTEPRLGVVLGLDNGASFGLFCLSPLRIFAGIHWHGDRNQTIPALVRLCGAAFIHRVAPLDLSTAARSAALIHSPAAVALDMEAHVGKHTLVIGDAGGFIAATSNEGIYPAMWSAKIAAEVVDRALDSVHSQDELMTFDALWRTQMAEYLRPPHTDLQFLLPLIFTNQPMADRMGAAFFRGEKL